MFTHMNSDTIFLEMGSIDERSEMGLVVKLDDLIENPDVKLHCKCTHVKDNEQLISRWDV